MNRWLNFKICSRFIIFIMTTIFSFIYETSANADLWLCLWCLSLVIFVDALDEISEVGDES